MNVNLYSYTPSLFLINYDFINFELKNVLWTKKCVSLMNSGLENISGYNITILGCLLFKL